MKTLNTHLQVAGPSTPVLALCWVKAFCMSVKQQWMLVRMYHLKF